MTRNRYIRFLRDKCNQSFLLLTLNITGLEDHLYCLHHILSDNVPVLMEKEWWKAIKLGTLSFPSDQRAPYLFRRHRSSKRLILLIGYAANRLGPLK